MSSSATSSIRRIQRELKEINESPSRHWTAAPFGDDLYEWQFTVRGPPGTDFEGGIYTGRLVLPVNYPLAPPSITLITPNGRWEVGKKICLSNTSYHPDLWQPAWGIRTMVEALRSHFPVPGDGAIGALDWPSDLRRKLAKESLDFSCHPQGKRNRELLPELSPEELKEDMPEPPPTLAAASASPAHTLQAPSEALSPLPRAPLPEPIVAEGLRQRRSSSESQEASAPVPRVVRQRRGEGVRLQRRTQSVLVQFVRPPETGRGWLIMAINICIAIMLSTAVMILIDLIKDPPQILDALPDV